MEISNFRCSVLMPRTVQIWLVREHTDGRPVAEVKAVEEPREEFNSFTGRNNQISVKGSSMRKTLSEMGISGA